jgi:hypothetical protein
MKINELIFDMIVEEIKANQKTFFNELMTKWKTEVPELTDEQGERVFNRHNNIKNQISIENSAIVRFLKRHDGRFPDKKKYALNDLKQIQTFNFNLASDQLIGCCSSPFSRARIGFCKNF